MFPAQSFDLLRGQTREGDIPRCASMKEKSPDAVAAPDSCSLLTNNFRMPLIRSRMAVTYLRLPPSSQILIRQDLGDDRRTMGGRIREVGAHTHLQLTEHIVCRILRGSHGGQGADTLTIEAEVLGKGTGNQGLWHPFDQVAQPGSILLKSITESLICEVDEGQQSLGDDGVAKALPLVVIQVGTGGVVATAV